MFDIRSQSFAPDRLKILAKHLGIKRIDMVDIKDYGYIYFELAVIDLNTNNTYEEELATLCHELGHWVMYRIHLHKLLRLKYNRRLSEWFADFVGNIIRIFVVGRNNLSDEAWDKFKKSVVR